MRNVLNKKTENTPKYIELETYAKKVYRKEIIVHAIVIFLGFIIGIVIGRVLWQLL